MDVQQLGARHGGALESAPSWLWGIVGCCWALRLSVTPVSGVGRRAATSWLQVWEWKSSSLQFVDGGLLVREWAGVDSGDLRHPGRAQEE